MTPTLSDGRNSASLILKKHGPLTIGGELVLAGALTEPLDSGVIRFTGESPKIAEKFISEDRYVNNGLIRSWRPREWLTVVGDGAASILRP